jgi:hypothetical protein
MENSAPPSKADLLIYYDRAIEACNKEKQWAHERLTWLFTPQTILFAAIGVANSNNITNFQIKFLLNYIIPILGSLTTLVVSIGVFSAAFMHREWSERAGEAIKAYKKLGERDFENVMMFYNTKNVWTASITRWSSAIIPVSFLFCWIYIFIDINM